MREMRTLSLVVGWIGGLYGILQGGLLAFEPLYGRASSSPPLPQIGDGDAIHGTSFPSPPPLLAFIIVAAVLMVFGGVLALLSLRKQTMFSIYAFTLFAFSLLSLPSIGWIFLPATTLLFLAAVLMWIQQRGADVASLSRRK